MNFCRSCTLLVPFVPFVFLWQIAFAFLWTNTGTCPYGPCFRLFCFLAHRFYPHLSVATPRF